MSEAIIVNLINFISILSKVLQNPPILEDDSLLGWNICKKKSFKLQKQLRYVWNITFWTDRAYEESKKLSKCYGFLGYILINI